MAPAREPDKKSRILIRWRLETYANRNNKTQANCRGRAPIHQLWAQTQPRGIVGRLIDRPPANLPAELRPPLQAILILQIVAAFMLFFCNALISLFANAVSARCAINVEGEKVHVLTLVSSRGKITMW